MAGGAAPARQVVGVAERAALRQAGFDQRPQYEGLATAARPAAGRLDAARLCRSAPAADPRQLQRCCDHAATGATEPRWAIHTAAAAADDAPPVAPGDLCAAARTRIALLAFTIAARTAAVGAPHDADTGGRVVA